MTVINPNSVAGINSITVQSGNSLAVHKANGDLIRTITEQSGISTFSSISVGTATTDNSAGKSINIGLGASISQHTDNTLTFGTAGDPVAKFDASGQLLLGTGTARQKLHINASDSGAANMVFTNTTTGTSAGDGFIVGITGGEDAQINMQETANLKFSTADTERLRIGSAGQIGLSGANYGTSGQVLTSQGSGSAVQWATPSSGLSHAQQWYLTTNGNTASGNTDHVLPTDGGTWQKHSDAVGVRAGTLGSDMTYSGSGVFTFPVTGIWKIEFQGWWGIGASDSDHYLRSRIQTTINNSSYTTNQEQANSVKSDSTYTYQGFYVSCLFDVTDLSLIHI